MNRRQKIIVSVTGIFLVMLILLGLTYAYFLTRINGNPNNTSISVSTANLVLEYGNGETGNIVLEKILPGTPIPAKEFTVSNKGNATVEGYKVYLENVQNQLELKDDLTYTLTCKEYDIDDYDAYLEDGTALPTPTDCVGVSSATEFPSVMTSIVTNDIEEGKVQVYSLQVVYADDGDQSIDMNKIVRAKVNIYDGKTKFLATEIMNNGADVSFTTTTGTFVQDPTCGYGEQCLAAVAEGCPGTCYEEGSVVTTTETKNTKTIKTTVNISKLTNGTSWSDELQDYTNEGMFSTYDDLGTSYYFRGPISNNYVSIGSTCWRIVRIVGDGSVKLILEDQDNDCKTSNGNWDIPVSNVAGASKMGNFGYNDINGQYTMNYLNEDNNATNYDSSMAAAFKNYQSTLSNIIKTVNSNNTIQDVLKSGNWCFEDKAYNGGQLTEEEKAAQVNMYGSYSYETNMRLSQKRATLKCNGTIMNKYNDNTDMFIGTLTADEAVYAGIALDYASGAKSYLVNNYQKDMLGSFWTLSPYDLQGDRESAYAVYSMEYLTYGYDISVNKNNMLRPAIVLKGIETIITGNGTQSNPYVIG